MSEETAQLVLRQDREGVAVLTINRPEKFNAMNKDVLQRVEEHLDQLATDDAIDVVVFTGAGDKAFVAGADIQELNRRLPYDGIIGTMQRLYDKIASFSKPTIAAVNGIAFGGGHELALACDIRVGSTSALFALPETGLGILPAAGGTQRLAKIVGIGVATDMIMSGARLKADRAYELGLLTELVEPNELLDTAHEKAQRIRSKGPLALKLVKQVLQRGFDVDHETGMLLERLAQAVTYSSEEKAEGTSAFLEKREADYAAVHHERVIHRNHHQQTAR
jgi:enoyl-CoA hydratase